MRGQRLAISIGLLLLSVAAIARTARADALVVTRAMKASTIVEVFIEPNEIRVDLELGIADLDVFRNLMPDDIYVRLGNEPEPLTDRLPRFFGEDLVIRAGDGPPLVGRIEAIAPRRRVDRDEITGEPIGADEEAGEPVVFATLRYALPDAPATLTLTPPTVGDRRTPANIGFVVYHEGVPVNDFRYLGQSETVDLDWDDPWYSRFRNRNLWRRFDAPMSAFLYVEHFEVRAEIVVRPRDLQSWIDLGLEDAAVIPADDQGALKERVAAFLRERHTVRVDDRLIEPVLDRIHFVRRTLRQTGVIDPPEDLPVVSATLGVIFAYPITELPKTVTMDWTLFNDRIDRVPAVATDEAGGLPWMLTPEDPVLVWRNFLTNPSKPGLVAVAAPPRRGRSGVPVISILAAVLALGLLGRATRAVPRKAIAFAPTAALLGVAAIAWPYARVPVPGLSRGGPTPAETNTLITGLLTNVYRAFDYRAETDVYDMLAHSADGELLTDLYVDTKRALELRNQGGARVRVTDVTVNDATVEPLRDRRGFTARCTWDASGSVGHWGHLHQRTNRYAADLVIEPIDDRWRITGMTTLSEERVEPGPG